MVTEKEKDILAIYRKVLRLSGYLLILLLLLELGAGMLHRNTWLHDIDWTVTVNGKERNLAPGNMILPTPKRGDVITCSTNFPEEDFSYPALVFEPTRSDICVTCGDEILFDSKNVVQDAYNSLIEQISLRNADFSKPITISFTVNENNSFFSIPTIIYMEQKDGFSTFIRTRGITFVTSLFLFFVGVIGTVICSASLIFGEKLTPLINISQFTFWSSLCIFCHQGFIRIFIHNETINIILELVSFYLTILFTCLTIYPKLLSSKKHRRQANVLTFVYLGYCIATFILPLITPLRLLDTFFPTMIVLGVLLAYSLYRCVYHWTVKPERMSFPVTGFMVLLGYAIIEGLRLILFSAGLSFLGTPEMLVLCAGILIFTACSLIDYFMWYKNSTIQETVEESWKRFSEPNSQPGISGYQKTLALLKELEDSKAQYTIATISIDNIDELMLNQTPFPILEDNFARLLYVVFGSYGITGNLGNGKYLVALPDMPEGKMKQLLRAFTVLVQRDNENHPDAKIVFSYGYALSSDSEDEEIVKICQLANNSRQVQEQQLIQ